MKTLKFKNPIRITAVIAAILIFSTFTFAENPPSSSTKFRLAEFQKELVHKKLSHDIDFPAKAKQYGVTGTVKAEVTVAEDGRLITNEINGHPDFKGYVQERLNEVTIADYNMIGKTFIAKFDFRN